MSGYPGEHQNLLADTANRAFGEARPWEAAEAAGLANVMVREELGGFGGGFEDAGIVLMAAGRNAADLPIAEAIIAAKLSSEAGLETGANISLAAKCEGEIAEGENIFTGALKNVAFGRNADRIAALIERNGKHLICRFARSDATRIGQRANPAEEPRDHLYFERAKGECAETQWDAARLYRVMAWARACQMAGAMEAALALATRHVRERQQFGRPLAGFQAIQQQMALFAEETAAARMASVSAARAADRGEASFAMAAAKLRANQAAAVVTNVAHQVHGAIGFTREYDLQRFTRRLWAWKSEYGNDRHWAEEIGARVARAGNDGFWAGLVSGFAN
jgi:acyl-CoA dehydrogenase